MASLISLNQNIRSLQQMLSTITTRLNDQESRIAALETSSSSSSTSAPEPSLDTNVIKNLIQNELKNILSETTIVKDVPVETQVSSNEASLTTDNPTPLSSTAVKTKKPVAKSSKKKTSGKTLDLNDPPSTSASSSAAAARM